MTDIDKSLLLNYFKIMNITGSNRGMVIQIYQIICHRPNIGYPNMNRHKPN